MKLELIAPAGNINSLFAAFQYGADSVYLGIKTLNARASAENFTLEQLESLIPYAHKQNKKIYIALNILIKNEEFNEIFNLLSCLQKFNADGIIIQDLGLYEIIKKHFPHLAIHFSTQTVIHNLIGIKTAEKMGIKRVILARELTLEEIKYIRHNTKMELEVFIHGARCYSYSGLCLFSSMIGGRSGNRGMCAQPCRKLYAAENGKTGHFFSMYDLCALQDIPALIDMGVNAFKIEGRLKSPLYVAYVSSLYRKVIDGIKIDIEQAQNDLKTIFSRETKSIPKENEIWINPNFPGHLGLYAGTVIECKENYATFITKVPLQRYDGLKILDHQKNEPIGLSLREIIVNSKGVFEVSENTKTTIRLPEPISKGSKIYLTSKRSLQDEYKIQIPKLETPKIPIILDIKIEDTKFIISCLNNKKEYTAAISKAKDKGLDKKLLIKYFSRLGNTPYELKDINLSMPSEIFIPPKELNQIRRDFISGMPAITSSTINAQTLNHVVIAPKAISSTMLSIKIDNPDYIEYIRDKASQIIIEINSSFKPFDISVPLIFSLPPIIKQKDVLIYEQRINSLLSEGYTHFQISNLGHLELFKNKNVTICADYPLYIFNSYSLIALKNLGIKHGTLSPELNIKELKELIPIVKNNADIILYSDLPYFYSNNCVLDKKNITVENKERDRFMIINKNNTTLVINEKPYSLLRHTDELAKLGHTMFRIDFLYKNYTQKQVKDIIQAARI